MTILSNYKNINFQNKNIKNNIIGFTIKFSLDYDFIKKYKLSIFIFLIFSKLVSKIQKQYLEIMNKLYLDFYILSLNDIIIDDKKKININVIYIIKNYIDIEFESTDIILESLKNINQFLNYEYILFKEISIPNLISFEYITFDNFKVIMASINLNFGSNFIFNKYIKNLNKEQLNNIINFNNKTKRNKK